MRRYRPDVIHTNDVPSFQPAGHVARWLGVPIVTHVRFPFDGAAMRWFLRPGFTRALFVSDALRTEVCAGAPELFEGRADVLYDGVALPPLREPAERESLKRELGLPLDRPTIALTGQVSEIKGIWEFVEAARRMADRRTACCFAVLGDDMKTKGAVRQAMEARVAELGLSERFIFLGFRHDAPRLIPAFDVVAVPSHIEPLGNATLEAMAAGVPVVGSRVGGIPEMVVDGETGLLVPPKEPERLAGALERIVGDPALRDALGAGARRRAETIFSLKAHAAALTAVYRCGALRPRSVVGRPPGSFSCPLPISPGSASPSSAVARSHGPACCLCLPATNDSRSSRSSTVM